MRVLFNHSVRSLIDWLFRRRSPALLTMRIGLGCLVLALGGAAFDVSLLLPEVRVDVGFDSAGATPMVLAYGTGFVGLFLTVAGFCWELARYREEQRRLSRKRVVVVETRGLRDTSGAPLPDALPPSLQGRRDHVPFDIRQGVKDGEIVVPEAALEVLTALPADLKRRFDGVDRSDVTLVYGGLTPVPFTFLTGLLIDDEGNVVIFDWDRHAEAWRELDDTDDGKRFRFSGLGNSLGSAPEVALAVSVSYVVSPVDVRSKVGDIPVVALELEGSSPSCHWSEDKQRALGEQFLEAVINLGNQRVRRIHLFLAAQNSVVFRFGRLYDKRNLPEVVVYQYHKAVSPPYPWGVLMPVCGIERPAIV